MSLSDMTLEEKLIYIQGLASGSGGKAKWGKIKGTLANQLDLQAALEALQPLLVSAQNIKTINGASILGAGNLEIVGGGGNVKITNTTGWLVHSIAAGTSCTLSFTWESKEGTEPTGDGVLSVFVGGVKKHSRSIAQGAVSVDVSSYLSRGDNTVKLTVTDAFDGSKSLNFTINVMDLTMASTFDASTAYTGAISFPYTPTGAVSKTVHFAIDGTEIGTATVVETGIQKTFTIPSQTHGAHLLTAWFTCVINGTTITSNTLTYDLICYVAGNNTPIITGIAPASTVEQYLPVTVRYYVYNPAALTSSVTLKANGTTVQTITVDRTQQTWTFRPNTTGALSLVIQCGNVTKTYSVTVTASTMNVQAVTNDLELYLTAEGRSNGEANPAVWAYGSISATMTNFNFVSDGWLADADDNTMLRVKGSARVAIPLNIFQSDFRTTGKTIEIEFASSDVMDYDTNIITCWSGNRGFKITPQMAQLKSEQSNIESQYKENEHVRLAFVVEKRSENKLIYIYLNGIMCGVVQYPTDDDFSQMNPVGISIGSSYATTDIYCIRVYSNDLTRIQVLNNWIADTQNAEDKIERYQRNNIYDTYGVISIDKLPDNLPVMVWDIPVLPTYKGDKRNANEVTYTDTLNAAASFVADTPQMNVQGTSSQYYYRKNFKLKFSNGLVINGVPALLYALRAGAIPEKEFTLKADVASSEGCNNVELVRLYNDASKLYGILTPPQEDDSRIRVGIDGFPMVCFHNNGSETYFYGKFNFNNDKGNETTFGFSDGDESWEIRNNTDNAVLFKEWSSDWEDKFEGRYPDGNTDTTKLEAMVRWVASTNRAAATGNALASSYTDSEGTVHTVDNSAYRLAKFRTELEDHFDLDSSMFYYLFTELFLLVDSRAKNAFPTYFADAELWYWFPYDMDTAIGINNEGALVFSYNLEDTDTVGGAYVFNGQTSVFWCNLRDAFPAEIKAMYGTLRGQGLIDYTYIEGQFEAHQAKWSEAIFNEDSYSKCLEPLILNNDNTYLEMLQGSKEQQRKWWLYNRFRYIDSKYNAGDAKSDYITLRGYAKANITVRPYADIYATILYGSHLVSTRATRGQSYTLINPLDEVNDTEIEIFSCSQLASIGDISALKVGMCDISRATKLQSLKVGDSSAQYSNPNLRTLTFGNNYLLKTIDCRNCVNLGTGVTSAPDISGCVGVEEVYFDGTSITGITLPNAGMIRTLHLPATITNLTMLNQVSLVNFVLAGHSNITTLRIENSPAVDVVTIVEGLAPNSRVRLLDIAWELNTTTALTKLMQCRGLDENGGNVPIAVVSGTIHINGALSLATSLYCEEIFPYLTVTADSYINDIFTDKDGNALYDCDGNMLTVTEGAYTSNYTAAQIDEFIAANI